MYIYRTYRRICGAISSLAPPCLFLLLQRYLVTITTEGNCQMHAEGLVWGFFSSFFCCLCLEVYCMHNETSVTQEQYDNSVSGFYAETKIPN